MTLSWESAALRGYMCRHLAEKSGACLSSLSLHPLGDLQFGKLDSLS